MVKFEDLLFIYDVLSTAHGWLSDVIDDKRLNPELKERLLSTQQLIRKAMRSLEEIQI